MTDDVVTTPTPTALAGEKITSAEEVATLPVGSVLLCNANEVFWLAPMSDGTRVWFAPGYDPAIYSWDDAAVAEWAPLSVLHVGALDLDHQAAHLPAAGDDTGSFLL